MPEEKPKGKKEKGKWFSKIPTDIILSPGGMVLISFALIIEIIDIIPLPLLDQLWEIPLELAFMGLLYVIAKTPLKSMLIPFLVERIPVINDIFPTWVIRMLA